MKTENLDMLISISYNYPSAKTENKKFKLEEIYDNCLEADALAIEVARDEGLELEIDDDAELH